MSQLYVAVARIGLLLTNPSQTSGQYAASTALR